METSPGRWPQDKRGKSTEDRLNPDDIIVISDEEVVISDEEEITEPVENKTPESKDIENKEKSEEIQEINDQDGTESEDLEENCDCCRLPQCLFDQVESSDSKGERNAEKEVAQEPSNSEDPQLVLNKSTSETKLNQSTKEALKNMETDEIVQAEKAEPLIHIKSIDTLPDNPVIEGCEIDKIDQQNQIDKEAAIQEEKSFVIQKAKSLISHLCLIAMGSVEGFHQCLDALKDNSNEGKQVIEQEETDSMEEEPQILISNIESLAKNSDSMSQILMESGETDANMPEQAHVSIGCEQEQNDSLSDEPQILISSVESLAKSSDSTCEKPMDAEEKDGDVSQQTQISIGCVEGLQPQEQQKSKDAKIDQDFLNMPLVINISSSKLKPLIDDSMQKAIKESVKAGAQNEEISTEGDQKMGVSSPSESVIQIPDVGFKALNQVKDDARETNFQKEKSGGSDGTLESMHQWADKCEYRCSHSDACFLYPENVLKKFSTLDVDEFRLHIGKCHDIHSLKLYKTMLGDPIATKEYHTCLLCKQAVLRTRLDLQHHMEEKHGRRSKTITIKKSQTKSKLRTYFENYIQPDNNKEIKSNAKLKRAMDNEQQVGSLAQFSFFIIFANFH